MCEERWVWKTSEEVRSFLMICSLWKLFYYAQTIVHSPKPEPWLDMFMKKTWQGLWLMARVCRFPVRITKQRRLPVHWPAGWVFQPRQSLQPGPGQQTRSSYILREAGSVFPLTLLCSSASAQGLFSQSVLVECICFVQSARCKLQHWKQNWITFIMVNH